MSDLGLLLVGIALPFAAVGLCAIGLYLARRRRKAFAHVRGLYLEAVDPRPLVGEVHVHAAPDKHVCSFGEDCTLNQREAARQAAADRIKGGDR